MTVFYPRPVTAPELAYLRSDGFFSKLHAAIIMPAPVFACRLNGLPPSNDNVTWLNYNLVTTGAYTNVLQDMTLYIGSYAGAYDLGMVRIKSATATTLNICRTSEIAWVDGCYLTAVDEFNLWPRQAYFSGGSFLVDDDSPYSNQHSAQCPVVVMGPDAVLELTGATVNFQPDCSLSWTLGTGTLTYAWSAPGASATADMYTATPTITYNAVGTYRVGCEAVGSNGTTSVGYRTIYVWNQANLGATHFDLKSISADWSDGGWTFTMQMWDRADFTYIRDRAKVILFAEDYYGDAGATKINLSYTTAAYASIVATGWIQGESITWSAEQSDVTFTVKGAQYWLGQLPSWPAGIMDCAGTVPSDTVNADGTHTSGWMFYQGLTFDAFAWHILRYRSTATICMDVFPSGDTRRIIGSTAPWGNIWGQIKQFGESKFLISPCVDHLGRLFLQLDTQYVPAASRASIPVVMAITSNDLAETVDIPRIIVPEKSQIDLRTSHVGGDFSGAGGVENIDLFRSGSPGSALGRLGQPEIRSEIVALDQAQSNEIAGLLVGEANNPYKQIVMPLAENSRFFDIAPWQYGTISVAATDTPRGIVWVDQKIVVRHIEGNYDDRSGQLSWTLTAEAQSVPAQSCTLPMDLSTTTPIPPWVPGPIHLNPPVFPPRPLPATTCLIGNVPNGPANLAVSTTLLSGGPTYTKWYHCWLRPSTAAYKSQIDIYSTLFDTGVPDAVLGPFQVWAVDNAGVEIAQGVPVAYTGGANGVRSFVFSPSVATEIFGFEIKFPAWAIWLSTPAYYATAVIAYSYDYYAGGSGVWSNVNGILGAPDGSLASFYSADGSTGVIVVASGLAGITDLFPGHVDVPTTAARRLGLINDTYPDIGGHPISSGDYGIDWDEYYVPDNMDGYVPVANPINNIGVHHIVPGLHNPESYPYTSKIYYARLHVTPPAGGTAYIDAVSFPSASGESHSYELTIDSAAVRNVCQ